MAWLDKILSHTSLVKAKNKQLQQYSDHISYLEELLDDYRKECIELNQILIKNKSTDKNIDYAEIAKRKAELCSEFFTQLKEEQQKNEKLENEIVSLKHMLDRYEQELDKLRKD